MNVSSLVQDLIREARQRSYIMRLDFLDHTISMCKARLYFSLETFVQVYRNDRFNTSNFVLIHNGERIFGRDELDGLWHRHPLGDPERHDSTPEGRQPATLSNFLDEVEEILAEMDLP